MHNCSDASALELKAQLKALPPAEHEAQARQEAARAERRAMKQRAQAAFADGALAEQCGEWRRAVVPSLPAAPAPICLPPLKTERDLSIFILTSSGSGR